MVDVELDADDDGPAPPASAAVPALRSGQVTHRRVLASVRGLRHPALVVVVAVAGTLGAASALELSALRRDDAVVARFREVPGVVASLREAPAERWRATGPVQVVDGLAVGTQTRDEGLVTVVRDTLSGRELWTAPLTPDTSLACSAVVEDVLLCDAVDRRTQRSPNSDAVLGPLDRLVGYDVRDGTVLVDQELGHGTVRWTVAEDDVVLARQDGRQVTVQRRDGPAGALAWSAPLTGAPATTLGLQVRVDDGLVLVTGAVTAVLDLRDGTVLGAWPAGDRPGRPLELTTEGGGFTVWPLDDEAVWFDREGRAGARLPGRPLAEGVDDGSAPSVVVVDDGEHLRAVDVHDGVLWEAPSAGVAHARLAGRLVVEERRAWRVLDLATGDELWQADLGPGAFPGLAPVTDGVRVLVPGYEVATGRFVTARDLTTGRARWTAPLPERTAAITQVDGVVAASGGREVAFLD